MPIYINRIRSVIAELIKNWPLLSQLIRQQMILRYRRTFLGYCWTLVNPLMMIFIMGLVFSSLFKEDLIKFTAFLFAGMIPWNLINNVVNQSGFAFTSNEALIKKIYVPKIVFPISIVLTISVDALLSFAVLVFLIIVLGGNISWAIFFSFLALIIILIFSLGIGLIVSVATVFYRDLQHILSILMQGLFFLTPVLYIKDTVPKSFAILVSLNPISPLVEIFRTPISYRILPSNEILLMSIIISFCTLALGLIIFISQEKKLVYRL